MLNWRRRKIFVLFLRSDCGSKEGNTRGDIDRAVDYSISSASGAITPRSALTLYLGSGVISEESPVMIYRQTGSEFKRIRQAPTLFLTVHMPAL